MRSALILHGSISCDRVGITLNIHWAEAENPSDPAHREAAETLLQFSLGWFAQPVLVDGNYPEVTCDKTVSMTRRR